MTNLTRKNQKVFASSAVNNGQFGSLQATTKVISNDVETLQALAAYESGWNDAVVSGEQLPSLEEFQALNYINTYQTAYLLQKGFPEWSTNATYYIGDLTRETGGSKIYKSITDGNTGNALTDVTNWQLKLDIDNVTVENNIIINGDMEISQRGTSFASIVGGVYCLDRYQYTATGSMVHDVMQETDAPTFAQAGRLIQNSLKVDCTTADASIAAGDSTAILQKIEGYNFLEIAQKSFTLGFWVKATKTGVYCIGFRNTGNDRSYVSEYTVNTTDTWEFKTITVTASPSAGTWNYTNGIGLNVTWTLAAGSTFQTTADAWQTGNFFATSNQVNACDSTSNNFQITGVQIVKGAVDTEFKRRSFGEELALCERYFELLDIESASMYSSASGALWNAGHINFKTEKRVTPSATAQNIFYNNCSLLTLATINKSSVTARVTTSGATIYRVAFEAFVDAEL